MKSRSIRAIRKQLQEKRETVVQNAVRHFRETHDSIRKTAKLYAIPESTLRYNLQHKPMSKCHPTYFSIAEEAELAQHLKRMARLGYGYQRWQVCQKAENSLLAKGVNTTVGKDWYYGFITRNRLNTKVPKKRSMARVQGSSEKNISNYFVELEKCLTKYGLMNIPASIWNVDETGITLDFPPPKIVAGKGEKPYAITSGRRATTTVIAAGNALGETIPPYVIYKGERLMNELTTGCLPGTKFTMTKNGWSTSVTFLDFFKNHFLPTVTPRPCLLLYDGHSTHITLKVLETAKAEGVHMFVLPPHSSHLVQPLDVGVFGPFKAALANEAHKICHAEVGRQVVRADLPHLIGTAYKSAVTTPNLMTAFRKTGIVPFDPTAVCDEKENATEKTNNKAKTRKERKDVRMMKLLTSEIENNVREKLDNQTTVKSKDFIIPEHGAAVTEAEFIDKLKLKSENSNKKVTQSKAKKVVKKKELSKTKDNSDHIKVVDNKKLNKTQDKIEKVVGKRKLNKTQDSGKKKTKISQSMDSQVAGPSGENTDFNWVTQYNSDKNDSDSENDEANCIVCNQFIAPRFGKGAALEIQDWAKCDMCQGWVHLKYCTEVTRVLTTEEFKCPKCS